MSLRILLGSMFLGLVGVARGEELPALTQTDLRAAVGKALPLLTKGAVGHRENRTCFACHNQGLPVLALMTAKARGIAIDEEEVDKQLKFVADFLGRNREGYLQGKGQGGQADTAGYALLTLEIGGWKADETTAAVTEFLLQRHQGRDHYAANSSRPPTEHSPFTTSYVALRGLATFGTAEQRERIAKRTAQVREWLVKTPAKDNEDRAFRLFGLKLVARAASRDRFRRQRTTGQAARGWRLGAA